MHKNATIIFYSIITALILCITAFAEEYSNLETYTLFGNTNLTDGSWFDIPEHTAVLGNSKTNTLIVSNNTARYFYDITVELP